MPVLFRFFQTSCKTEYGTPNLCVSLTETPGRDAAFTCGRPFKFCLNRERFRPWWTRHLRERDMALLSEMATQQFMRVLCLGAASRNKIECVRFHARGCKGQ